MLAHDIDSAMTSLQDMIREAKVVLPFTGAGISTECGIPDFRSPGGIWTKNRPIPFDEFLASQEARNKSWRRRFALGDAFGHAQPGRGHRALASLYHAGKVPAVVTQNIDNLHQASGIAPEHVVELHGNTTYALCLDCERQYELSWVRERMDAGNGCAPDCETCGGFIKTATISFGQAMPDTAMRRAQDFTLVLRFVSGDRLFTGGLAGCRFPLDGKKKRRPFDHHQPRADRFRRRRRSGRARRHRHGARTVRLSYVIHRCSQAVTLFPRVSFLCFPLGWPNVIFNSTNSQIRERPAGRPTKSGSHCVMASDGIETKSTGVGFGLDVDLSDEAAAQLIEVSGVIKWFDVAKGYGFIVPDNGMADVLLHVTCLRRDGYQTAYEGARIVCEVLPRPKGLQAFRVSAWTNRRRSIRRRCHRRGPMLL